MHHTSKIEFKVVFYTIFLSVKVNLQSFLVIHSNQHRQIYHASFIDFLFYNYFSKVFLDKMNAKIVMEHEEKIEARIFKFIEPQLTKKKNALIFYQLLPNNSERKCTEISWENLPADIGS